MDRKEMLKQLDLMKPKLYAAISMLLAGLLGLWLYSRYIKKHPRVG